MIHIYIAIKTCISQNFIKVKHMKLIFKKCIKNVIYLLMMYTAQFYIHIPYTIIFSIVHTCKHKKDLIL